VLGEGWLESRRNNWLVALVPEADQVGLAALDLTTGEFVWELVPAVDLGAALARYEPSEVVLPAQAGVAVPQARPEPTARVGSSIRSWAAKPGRALGLASLDGSA